MGGKKRARENDEAESSEGRSTRRVKRARKQRGGKAATLPRPSASSPLHRLEVGEDSVTEGLDSDREGACPVFWLNLLCF